MPRRAASGHIPATHPLKFAAAARIAVAVIKGWPEAPSSPLQGGAPAVPGALGCCASGLGPEKMPPNRFDRPLPDDWACAGATDKAPASSSAAAVHRLAIGSLVIADPLPRNSGIQEARPRFPE